MMKKLPELLCPAGSPEALDAAIEGGADAIYFGGASFNARMNAKNFGGDALRSAVLRAHTFGVKTYLTLNTLVTDRELPSFVDAAREALRAGVDALIVADLGGAAAIKRAIPSAELHASTQMSGHTAAMGHELSRLGFSRMVIARETSAENIRTVVQNSPIEVEIFVHGALCVSHSGQCLFSSLVGGRSGNRGECAQPCRLPYTCTDCKGRKREGYPLSLKDLSLATHLPELIDIGVASLKIEGRMKSPEYVRDTARIWRRLLDEHRAATPAEMHELSEIFSRGGFTDGYYMGRIDHKMLGVRSEDDKSNSRTRDAFSGLSRRHTLDIKVSIKADRPMQITLSDATRSVTVCGDTPMPAINSPLSHENAERNLTKLGATLYRVGKFSLELDDGLMLPLSRLNDLRRRAIAAWEEGLQSASVEEFPHKPLAPSAKRTRRTTARFYKKEQITKQAEAYFDRIYLPLEKFAPPANGVILPPVIFDSAWESVELMLKNAAQNGAKYAMVGNVGHLELVRKTDLVPVGDFRFNVTNTESAARLESLGIFEYILSPELTLPQMRDLGGNCEAIVYGRLPMMTLEKCAISEIADCKTCATDSVVLRDRKGMEFPILREWEHRNTVYNSLPTSMSDRQSELDRADLIARHFLFTVESTAEVDRVITAHKKQTALSETVRRIR